MKESRHMLYLGMGLSLMAHIALCGPFVMKKGGREDIDRYPAVALVSVQITPKPPPEAILETPKPVEKSPPKALPEENRPVRPAPKPKPRKKMKPRRPLQTEKKKIEPTDMRPAAHKTPEQPLAPKDQIKPVFGVSRDSTGQAGDSGSPVRVGNTLMKAQEEDFTPAEEVEDHPVVPPFELSSLPLYKNKVVPEYPASLMAAEMEGEVLLAVTIDRQGKVIALEVKHSDNALFTEAAKAALEKCEFTPGMQNGMPVVTTIDIPIKFILDE